MKHLVCTLLLLAFLTRVHAQPNAQPSAAPPQHPGAVANLIAIYDADKHTQLPAHESKDTFEIIIRHTTTLFELVKIQKKVFRKLGISLSYRTIDFDSAGLSGISIEARKGSICYPIATCQKLKEIADFGIFSLTTSNDKHCYIGAKSDWLKTANPSFKPNSYLSNL